MVTAQWERCSERGELSVEGLELDLPAVQKAVRRAGKGTGTPEGPREHECVGVRMGHKAHPGQCRAQCVPSLTNRLRALSDGWNACWPSLRALPQFLCP